MWLGCGLDFQTPCRSTSQICHPCHTMIPSKPSDLAHELAMVAKGRLLKEGGPDSRKHEPTACAAPSSLRSATEREAVAASAPQLCHDSRSDVGRVEVITGPMFAGKSTELLKRTRAAQAAGMCVRACARMQVHSRLAADKMQGVHIDLACVHACGQHLVCRLQAACLFNPELFDGQYNAPCCSIYGQASVLQHNQLATSQAAPGSAPHHPLIT